MPVSPGPSEHYQVALVRAVLALPSCWRCSLAPQMMLWVSPSMLVQETCDTEQRVERNVKKMIKILLKS